MKRLLALIILLVCVLDVNAQTEDLQLAQQFTTNGELQKASEIYAKLYKQNSEAFYSFYLRNLLSLKKYDEAESITKKMARQHPKDFQFPINLARIYHERGSQDKADSH